MAGPQFTPDLVYNLIANNPQGRVFVENLAKMNQLQQAAQQFAPQVQQFAQNPMQAVQNIGDWAQGAVNQMSQPQAPQQLPANAPQANLDQQAGVQPQQGGAPVQGGMMGMAMEIVGKFENSFKEMSETLEVIKESNSALTEELATLTKSNATFASELEAIRKDNKTCLSSLEAARKDLGKLASAKG